MERYRCTFRTINAKGEVLYENKNSTFGTRDLSGYIARTQKRYANHNIKAEFSNIEKI